MNENDLIERDLTDEELENITGSQAHIVQEIKNQRCVDAFKELKSVLPDMTGVMMEQIKYRINLEMKARKEGHNG